MADNNREAWNQEIVDIIRSMEQDGIVDFRLADVRNLKEENGPFFFAELLPTFCSDSQISLRALTVALDQPVMDFHEVRELCLKIRGGTSCIGGCRMADACGELRDAVDNRSKEECIAALNKMKLEFAILKERMDVILQLERRIILHDH